MSKKAIIVRDGHLGDIILSTCIVDPLHCAGFERIDWLANRRILELAPWIPHCAKTFVVRERRELFLQWKLMGELRREKYDLMVILECSSRYNPLAFMAGAREVYSFHERPLNRIGVDRALYWDYGVSILENCGRLIKPLLKDGQAGLRPWLEPPRQWASPRLRQWIERQDKSCSHVTVHPGSSQISLRSWPVEHYRKLIESLLAQPDIRIVLSGTPAELGPFGDLYSSRQGRVVEFFPDAKLDELCGLILFSDLFLSADTGPMHLACALQKPQVALYGPTRPADTGPVNPGALIVESPYWCRGCLFEKERKAQRERCQSGGQADCYTALTPDQVIEAIRNRWGDSGRILRKELLRDAKPIPSLEDQNKAMRQ